MNKFAMIAVLFLSSLSFAQYHHEGHGWGPRPPRRVEGKACFYTEAYFRGPAFCLTPGPRGQVYDVGQMGGFNDRISSILIEGPIRVSIYEHAGMRGDQATIYGSVDNLQYMRRDHRQSWNDVISSIVVDYR